MEIFGHIDIPIDNLTRLDCKSSLDEGVLGNPVMSMTTNMIGGFGGEWESLSRSEG